MLLVSFQSALCAWHTELCLYGTTKRSWDVIKNMLKYVSSNVKLTLELGVRKFSTCCYVYLMLMSFQRLINLWKKPLRFLLSPWVDRVIKSYDVNTQVKWSHVSIRLIIPMGCSFRTGETSFSGHHRSCFPIKHQKSICRCEHHTHSYLRWNLFARMIMNPNLWRVNNYMLDSKHFPSKRVFPELADSWCHTLSQRMFNCDHCYDCTAMTLCLRCCHTLAHSRGTPIWIIHVTDF